jgi:uncharacterized protein (TIRG00374 family)
MVVADTAGWLTLTGLRPSARHVCEALRIRIATEALSNSLPAGTAVAEAARAVLLRARTGLEASHAAGASYLSRLCLTLAHILFGLSGLCMLPSTAVGLSGLASPLTVSLAIAAGMLGLAGLAFSGAGLSALAANLGRIRWRPLAPLSRKTAPFLLEMGGFVSRLSRENPARLGWSTFAFLLGWLALALDSYLMLKVLGVDVHPGQAIAIEATVALARGTFMFVPGGLGAQELAYIALFSAFGYPETSTVGAAFAALKRARELAWLAAGYTLLAALRTIAGGPMGAPGPAAVPRTSCTGAGESEGSSHTPAPTTIRFRPASLSPTADAP